MPEPNIRMRKIFATGVTRSGLGGVLVSLRQFRPLLAGPECKTK